MTDFKNFGLSAPLIAALEEMKYETPTPIQQQAIPLALQGRDLLGSAQTGTGKTAAFGIPLVNALLTTPRGSALVLTPTRELGRQVMDVLTQLLGKNSRIQTAFLIGGESMGLQLTQLRRRPRLIVGTPGRINDHLERGNLMLHDTNFLVLDETDRMLDMGFGIQIDRIIKFMTAKRQTLLFSATLPPQIVKLSSKYLKNPERVAVGHTHEPIKKISQEIVRIKDESGKYNALKSHLKEWDGSVIIFVGTKHGADRLAQRLRKDKYVAEALHGDLRQAHRDQIIKSFRDKNYRILVATDIAARGLDIPHVECVVNYDLPQSPEDYIHRIGRTARAGADGDSLTFISPRDNLKWDAIERLLGPDTGADAKPKTSKHPTRPSRRKSKNPRPGMRQKGRKS